MLNATETRHIRPATKENVLLLAQREFRAVIDKASALHAEEEN